MKGTFRAKASVSVRRKWVGVCLLTYHSHQLLLPRQEKPKKHSLLERESETSYFFFSITHGVRGLSASRYLSASWGKRRAEKVTYPDCMSREMKREEAFLESCCLLKAAHTAPLGHSW